MKKKYIYYIIIFLQLSLLVHAEEIKNEISDYDIKAIEKADPFSAGEVLYKLERIYMAYGKNAIQPAIPALIKRATRVFNNPNLIGEDPEAEQFLDYIKVLSVSGDKRIEPLFVSVMVSKNIHTPDLAKGFNNIGKSIIPIIIDSLKSKEDWTIIKSSITVRQMVEFDSTSVIFSAEDKRSIKNILESNLKKDKNVKLESIRALREFGDINTANILKVLLENEKDIRLLRDLNKSIENIELKNK